MRHFPHSLHQPLHRPLQRTHWTLPLCGLLASSPWALANVSLSGTERQQYQIALRPGEQQQITLPGGIPARIAEGALLGVQYTGKQLTLKLDRGLLELELGLSSSNLPVLIVTPYGNASLVDSAIRLRVQPGQGASLLLRYGSPLRWVDLEGRSRVLRDPESQLASDSRGRLLGEETGSLPETALAGGDGTDPDRYQQFTVAALEPSGNLEETGSAPGSTSPPTPAPSPTPSQPPPTQELPEPRPPPPAPPPASDPPPPVPPAPDPILQPIRSPDRPVPGSSPGNGVIAVIGDRNPAGTMVSTLLPSMMVNTIGPVPVVSTPSPVDNPRTREPNSTIATRLAAATASGSSSQLTLARGEGATLTYSVASPAQQPGSGLPEGGALDPRPMSRAVTEDFFDPATADTQRRDFFLGRDQSGRSPLTCTESTPGACQVSSPAIFPIQRLAVSGASQSTVAGASSPPATAILLGGFSSNPDSGNPATTNFFYAQVDDACGGSCTYIYAHADALPPPPAGAGAVDRYRLTAGLNGYSEGYDRNGRWNGATVAPGLRSFGRAEQLPQGVQPGSNQHRDTGLYVIYPPGELAGQTQRSLLHADFAVSGSGAAQQTAISLTLGDYADGPVAVRDTNAPQALPGLDAFGVPRNTQVGLNPVRLTTVGSSHRAAEGSQGPASTLLEGTTSLTVAGHRPDAHIPAVDESHPTYLLLQSHLPGDASAQGSRERPLGTAAAVADNAVALLRLGTLVESRDAATLAAQNRSRSSETRQGYLAGLAEQERNGGILVGALDSGDRASNFVVQTDAANQRVAISANLLGPSGEARPVSLGGLEADIDRGLGVVIYDHAFGAQSGTASPDSRVAAVSSGVFESGLPAPFNVGFQHLQWGFFFGDVDTREGMRLHAPLAPWMTGLASPPDIPLPAGSASYAGSAIGNVYNGGALYTAVGRFNNQWNFGTRSGTVTMDFDGAQYSGRSELRPGVNHQFNGTLDAVSAGRSGGLTGQFFQGGGDPTAAVGGRFSVQGAGTSDYRAAGVFGAEKVTGP